MVGRIGLTEVYHPVGDRRPSAQIVFVHGLFGHPQNTWSSKPRRRSHSPSGVKEGNNGGTGSDEPVFWPQTLLPEVLPDAQIFTWGYDADIGGFFSSAGQSTIHEHAGSLLSDLSDLRNKPEVRVIPLIFVVHSLGGIIVKDALNQSSSTEGTRLKEVVAATYGVVFLGTPHKGSSSASLGKIAYHITELATRRPNIKLLQGLERHSEVLTRIGDSFLQTVLKYELSIYSFREERETRKYVVFNTMIVDSDSAKIGHARGECGSIPADHRNMTKFGELEDIGFKRISAQLRRWNDDMKAISGCLASLDDVSSRHRFQQVHDAYPATFDWLFESKSVPFLLWLQDDARYRHQPFWIQGKPGSGKSTLMKFALRDPRMRDNLPSVNNSKWTFSSYFFHNRGSQSQKTLVAMLQEILHSILIQNPFLTVFVLYFYNTLKTEQRTSKPSWDVTNLRAAILAILRQSECKANLCLFLDALDEHVGQNEQLVAIIEDMNAAAEENMDYIRIKLCLASRPWDIFKKHLRHCPQFAIHEHTYHDIEMYTSRRIRGAMYTADTSSAEIDLIAQIVQEASGAFIWVRIVMDQVTQDIIDGTPLPTIKRNVAQLPSELEELYRLTIHRIKFEYHIETWIMLQVVLCALQPLSLDTLIRLTDLHTQHGFLRLLKQRRFPVRVAYEEAISPFLTDKQLHRLNSRSGGLLEAVVHQYSSEDHAKNQNLSSKDYRVQFIHQTVKDSLIRCGTDLGFHVEQRDHNTNGTFNRSGYVFLLSACCPDISWSRLEIKSDAMIYAKLAEQRAGVDEARLQEVANLTSFMIDPFAVEVRKRASEIVESQRGKQPDVAEGWERLGLWLSHYLREIDSSDDTRGVKLILAVASDLVHTTKIAIANFTSWSLVETATDLGPNLLCLAAIGPKIVPLGLRGTDASVMIEMLINAGCNSNAKTKPPGDFIRDSRKYDRILLDYYAITPLTAVCLGNYSGQHDNIETKLEVAKTLIRNGARVSNVQDNTVSIHVSGIVGSSETVPLIEYLFRYGNIELVRLLLSHMDVEEQSPRFLQSLSNYARLRQDAEIIQAMEDYGFHLRHGLAVPIDSGLSDGVIWSGEMAMSTSGGIGAMLGPEWTI